MNKIKELNEILKSGSRSNKYRVIYPLLGRNLDIQCHDVTSPGRGIGVIDIYLKGREFKIAGDRADVGSITLSFYNDPELIIRRFFLRIISGIQSYSTPESIEFKNFTTSFNNFNNPISNFLNNPLLNSIKSVSSVYNEMKYNINNIKTNIKHFNNFSVSNNHGRGYSFYRGRPWYMNDLIIQQLDHNENVISQATYNNAFISSVSDISYNDEVGEITRTELTINYSGVNYGSNFEMELIDFTDDY